MCEATFLACPHCHTDFTENGEFSEDERTTRTYPVDSDGDPIYDCPSDGDSEVVESNYYCRDCGAYPTRDELIENYSPDDCDCEECEPLMDDPDEVVTLVRRQNIEASLSLGHQALMIAPDKPPEIEVLLTRRSVRFLPIRRERADDIELWLEAVGCRGEITVQSRTPPASHLALAVPEPEPEPEEELHPIIQLSMVEHESEAA